MWDQAEISFRPNSKQTHNGVSAFAKRMGVDPKRVYNFASKARRFYSAAVMPSPHGCYVYFLLSPKRELLYVGQSTNIYSRLGSHFAGNQKRQFVRYVEIILCKDETHMDELEIIAIEILKPPWNIQHNPSGKGFNANAA